MRNSVIIGSVAILLAIGCSKDSDKPSGGGDEAGKSTESATKDNAKAPAKKKYGDKQFFDYPPAGEGPHTGWDLDALRDKLQGVWLLGGGYFSPPTIWHIEGDLLTVMDGKSEGGKKISKLELLAPCYYVTHDMDGNSSTYSHLVFDGDTLYAGLGASGVKDDKRTLGCLSVSMYELVGDECTKWNKASFPRKGEPIWTKEKGDCGYTEQAEDGKVFYADDTNSSRKLYGRRELKIIVNNALMTQQMQGNKAEKAASLDEAIATQKNKIEEIAERKKKK